MFKLQYQNEYLDAMVTVTEDETLMALFSKFVELTRIAGFEPRSWDKVINDVVDCNVRGDGYNIYRWADDTMLEIMAQN